MYYCGIDIGKASHVASIINSDGNLIKTFPFKNSAEGFNKFLEMSKSISNDIDEISFAMEATGHYWLNIYSFLIDFSKNLYVINPIQSEALRNLFIKSNKSDAIDSFLIAEVIRINRFTSSSMADDNTMALKELTRFRTFQAQSIASLKLKAIKVLDVIFPEYTSAFSDIFGKTSMEILLNFPTPDQLIAISTTKLTKFIYSISKGRIGEEKSIYLKEIATKSIGINVGKAGFIFELQSIINQIKFIESQIKDLDDRIKELYLSFDCFLHTITGIGFTNASIILSEIGDINKFENDSKLTSFAGLDPTEYSSGTSVKRKSKMSKRGSSFLRLAIWNASVIAAFKDSYFNEYYLKKREEGKSYKGAIAAVSKKMTRVIFKILKDKRPYTKF